MHVVPGMGAGGAITGFSYPSLQPPPPQPPTSAALLATLRAVQLLFLCET